MFVSEERVPVTVENESGTHTIWLRRDLSVLGKATVEDAIVSIKSGGNMEDVSVSVGAFSLVLLKVYIAAWTGPKFERVPCTISNILRLDAKEPMVIAAAERAALLYKELRSDPKAPAAPSLNGSAPLLESPSPLTA